MSELVVEDRAAIRRVPLSRLVTIGRSHNNDLVLSAVFASRRHAWVWRQGDQFIIEDLGSTHGTYVNGQRLVAPRFLNDRDVIIMGEARLTFVEEQDLSTERTPPHGVPQVKDSQVYCASCGAPNHPAARTCQHCGSSLSPGIVFTGGLANDQVRTSRPITPLEPVVARPFPTVSSHSSADIDRRVWILILLLAILAVSLVTIVAILVAYVLL